MLTAGKHGAFENTLTVLLLSYHQFLTFELRLNSHQTLFARPAVPTGWSFIFLLVNSDCWRLVGTDIAVTHQFLEYVLRYVRIFLPTRAVQPFTGPPRLFPPACAYLLPPGATSVTKRVILEGTILTHNDNLNKINHRAKTALYSRLHFSMPALTSFLSKNFSFFMSPLNSFTF